MNESSFFLITVIVVILVFFSVSKLPGHSPAHIPASSQNTISVRQNDITSKETRSLPGAATSSQEALATEHLVSATSSYAGYVHLTYGYPYVRSSDEQYIRIDASYANREPVNITGWRLYSPVTGQSAAIGYGSNLPSLGEIAHDPIVLKPNEYAYIISGQSPEGGLSFRDNKCTGYFAANKQFYPSVSGSCPRPTGQVPYRSVANPNGLPIDCADYLNTLPYCAIVPSVPARYAACAEYVSRHYSYPGCIDDFKNDRDFYLNHWFVYLNRSDPLWLPAHETIVLYDADGAFVDSFSY